MKRLILAAAALSLVLSPAAMAANTLGGAVSQAGAAGAGGDYTYFTIDILKQAMTELGMTDFKEGTSTAGNPYITAKDPATGYEFDSFLAACNSGQCLGLELSITWAGSDLSVTHAQMNEFNVRYVFAKGFIRDDSKEIVLSRYVIADGGVSHANLVENYRNFIGMPQRLFGVLGLQ